MDEIKQQLIEILDGALASADYTAEQKQKFAKARAQVDILLSE